MGGSHESYTIGQPLEPDGLVASVAETQLVARERAVLAREQAVLAREQAADRHTRAADQREQTAARREQAATATARLQLQSESELREANERLIVAVVDAQTTTDVAEQAAKLMSVKAERDFLTGLPNRALLADRLTQSMEFAHRYGRRVALMFVDLDNFKEVNDSLGHAVGDMLLQSAAIRLQACVRASDTVSRHGGDEFVLLLTEVTTAQDAVVVADKLIKAMTEPYPIGSHRLHVTLSIGICIYPDDGADAESILAHADMAMYCAKRGGRNTYRRFTAGMLADSATQRSLPGSTTA